MGGVGTASVNQRLWRTSEGRRDGVNRKVSADKVCPGEACRGSGCHFLGWAYLEVAGAVRMGVGET